MSFLEKSLTAQVLLFANNREMTNLFYVKMNKIGIYDKIENNLGISISKLCLRNFESNLINGKFLKSFNNSY